MGGGKARVTVTIGERMTKRGTNGEGERERERKRERERERERERVELIKRALFSVAEYLCLSTQRKKVLYRHKFHTSRSE